MKTLLIISIIFSFTFGVAYADGHSAFCKKKKSQEKEKISANINGNGYEILIDFETGKSHNNPSFAIWIEDMDEEFIQEVFVTKSIATGIFRYGDSSTGTWQAGEKMYKATLPYFFHKRTDDAEIPNKTNPILDAYTGATPQNDFILTTRTDKKDDDKFRLVLEINQAWDSNNYWNNSKYPDEKEYRNSCQPSLVYAVTIDPRNLMDEYTLNPIGHGHFAGKDGKLYTDLSTFTTALKIADDIKVKVK